MGLDSKPDESGALEPKTESKAAPNEEENQTAAITRKLSEASLTATEDEEEDGEERELELGPQRTLKEEFEKDKVMIFLLDSFTSKHDL